MGLMGWRRQAMNFKLASMGPMRASAALIFLAAPVLAKPISIVSATPASVSRIILNRAIVTSGSALTGGHIERVRNLDELFSAGAAPWVLTPFHVGLKLNGVTDEQLSRDKIPDAALAPALSEARALCFKLRRDLLADSRRMAREYLSPQERIARFFKLAPARGQQALNNVVLAGIMFDNFAPYFTSERRSPERVVQELQRVRQRSLVAFAMARRNMSDAQFDRAVQSVAANVGASAKDIAVYLPAAVKPQAKPAAPDAHVGWSHSRPSTTILNDAGHPIHVNSYHFWVKNRLDVTIVWRSRATNKTEQRTGKIGRVLGYGFYFEDPPQEVINFDDVQKVTIYPDR